MKATSEEEVESEMIQWEGWPARPALLRRTAPPNGIIIADRDRTAGAFDLFNRRMPPALLSPFFLIFPHVPNQDYSIATTLGGLHGGSAH